MRGGEEGVAGREEIDALQARRVEAHAGNPARQVMGEVDLLDRLPDQDAAGVDARAGLALGFDHRDLEAARCGGACGSQSGEARADNQEVEFHERPPTL